MSQCRNCQTPLTGNFCPECGQKNVDLERPILDLVGEILKETFDVDGRAFRTLGALLTKPGYLTVEFLAGRRRAFTPPLRLYLVLSVSFFILVAWAAGKGVLLDPGQSVEEHAESQAQFMANDLPRLMFVLLPIFALLLKLLYRKRLYFDHLIHSLHLHSLAFIVLGLMLPIERLADINLAAMLAQAALLLALVIYFGMSVHTVYRSRWIVSSLKSFAVLFGYLIVVSVAIEMTSNLQILAD